MNNRLFSILIILLIPIIVLSQNPISVGMGGTGTSFVNGLFAVGQNPAGLANRETTDSTHFEIMFPSIYFAEANNAKIIFSDYKLEDGYLTDQDKEDLLASLGDPTSFNAILNMKFLGVAYHHKYFSIGFDIGENTENSFVLPNELARFGLYGNIPDELFDFNEFSGEMLWYRSYGITIGTKYKKLSVGATIKYLQGLQYATFSCDTARIHTNADYQVRLNMKAEAKVVGAFLNQVDGDLEFEYATMPDVSNSGIGFDIGAQYELSDNLNLGVAITDIGSINWSSDNAAKYTASFEGEIIEITDEDYLDSLFSTFDSEREEIDGFTTKLTPKLSLGASYLLKPNLLAVKELFVSAETNFFLGDEPVKYKAKLIALGLRWKFHDAFPEVLAGFSHTTIGTNEVSFGLGYEKEKFGIYLSSSNASSVFSEELEICAAFGMRFRF